MRFSAPKPQQRLQYLLGAPPFAQDHCRSVRSARRDPAHPAMTCLHGTLTHRDADWLNDAAADPRRATFPAQNLNGAHLQGDLRKADLRGRADLSGAQVSKAQLAAVDLTGATCAARISNPEIILSC